MDTPTLLTPQRNWHAYNNEGANGWVVAPLHPSGDGSHYAAITQRLTKEDARLIAAAPDLLTLVERVAKIEHWQEIRSIRDDARALLTKLKAS